MNNNPYHNNADSFKLRGFQSRNPQSKFPGDSCHLNSIVIDQTCNILLGFVHSLRYGEFCCYVLIPSSMLRRKRDSFQASDERSGHTGLGGAEETFPCKLQAIGNVEPYSVVSVKSLVGGELTKVYFKEGQEVKKGDLLFIIDPRPLKQPSDRRRPTWEEIGPKCNRRKRPWSKDKAQVKPSGSESGQRFGPSEERRRKCSEV